MSARTLLAIKHIEIKFFWNIVIQWRVFCAHFVQYCIVSPKTLLDIKHIWNVTLLEYSYTMKSILCSLYTILHYIPRPPSFHWSLFFLQLNPLKNTSPNNLRIHITTNTASVTRGAVFANCPGDRVSITGWVIPKTKKTVCHLALHSAL